MDLCVHVCFRNVLHKYANEDVSLGAWFIGLDVDHIDDRRLCCGTPPGKDFYLVLILSQSIEIQSLSLRFVKKQLVLINNRWYWVIDLYENYILLSNTATWHSHQGFWCLYDFKVIVIEAASSVTFDWDISQYWGLERELKWLFIWFMSGEKLY